MSRRPDAGRRALLVGVLLVPAIAAPAIVHVAAAESRVSPALQLAIARHDRELKAWSAVDDADPADAALYAAERSARDGVYRFPSRTVGDVALKLDFIDALGTWDEDAALASIKADIRRLAAREVRR